MPGAVLGTESRVLKKNGADKGDRDWRSRFVWAVRESFSCKVSRLTAHVCLKHKGGGARWHLGGNVPSQNETGVGTGAARDSEEQGSQQGTS